MSVCLCPVVRVDGDRVEVVQIFRLAFSFCTKRNCEFNISQCMSKFVLHLINTYIRGYMYKYYIAISIFEHPRGSQIKLCGSAMMMAYYTYSYIVWSSMVVDFYLYRAVVLGRASSSCIWCGEWGNRERVFRSTIHFCADR